MQIGLTTITSESSPQRTQQHPHAMPRASDQQRAKGKPFLRLVVSGGDPPRVFEFETEADRDHVVDYITKARNVLCVFSRRTRPGRETMIASHDVPPRLSSQAQAAATSEGGAAGSAALVSPQLRQALFASCP